MSRSKDEVIADLTKFVNDTAREAFYQAMSTKYTIPDGNEDANPVELADLHVRRMSVIFGESMKVIVKEMFININDYQAGSGEDLIQGS